MLPEIGRSGNLKMMRKYLRMECGMLQVWHGKTVDDDDYITYVCDNAEHYAVLQSPANSRDYTIIVAGDIMFMHRKNLEILAANAD